MVSVSSSSATPSSRMERGMKCSVSFGEKLTGPSVTVKSDPPVRGGGGRERRRRGGGRRGGGEEEE